MINLKSVFGYDGCVPNNIVYINTKNEHFIVYLAGHTFVIFNIDTKEKQVVMGSENFREFSFIILSVG